MHDAERDALLIRLDERSLKVDKALFGNGHEGMVAVVAKHDARLNAFDTIYAAGLATQGPLMQEWGDFKGKVQKLEENVPSTRTTKVTIIAALTALVTACAPFAAHLMGITLPVATK